MTGILVGGILTLAPSILQTVVLCTKYANPSSLKFSSLEKKVLDGQYQHLIKKLEFLKSLLNSNSIIPALRFEGDDEQGYMLNEEFFSRIWEVSESLAILYENFLENKIFPVIFEQYYSSDIEDENLLLPSIVKLPEFQAFDKSMLFASSMETAFSPFALHTPNYHFGSNLATSTILTKLLDDSILAFSRIAPNRLICPTKFFCIFPNTERDWSLGESCVQSYNSVISNGDVKLTVKFTKEFLELKKLYSDLYTFEVLIEWEFTTNNNGLFSVSNTKLMGKHTVDITRGCEIIEFKADGWANTYYESFRFKTYGKVRSANILAKYVSKMHSLDEIDFTYGNLMSKGNYLLDDPIFGVRAIIINTIGSAQFSIQTAFALLAAWVLMIQLASPEKSNQIRVRYTSLISGFELDDLCSMGRRLIKPQKMKGQALKGLNSLWDRIINDLNFMKKYILRTKAGKILVSNVIVT